MLNILLEIDKVCKAHGLRYFLAYGTMMGAAHYKGFLPWDDDTDIHMPRPDYEQLMAHGQEWLPEWLEVRCPEHDPTFPLPFMKVMDRRTTLVGKPNRYYVGGVFVDVTPLDGLPKRPWLQKRHIRQVRRRIHLRYVVAGNTLKKDNWWPKFWRKSYSPERVQALIREQLMKYDYEQSDWVTEQCDVHIRKPMPKSWFEPARPVEFEGHELCGLALPEPYLQACFGEFQPNPSAEAQARRHYQYLDLQHPYKDYQAKQS